MAKPSFSLAATIAATVLLFPAMDSVAGNRSAVGFPHGVEMLPNPFAHWHVIDTIPLLLPVWERQDPMNRERLTDDDYRAVAEELGVEVAAMKAVVDIEAGIAHQGFWDFGRPLINFDLSVFRQFAPRHGVSLKKARQTAPVAFARPDVRRYGSYQAAQQARLDAACSVDSVAAWESSFWGMFQIGGFNWRKCGL